MGKNKDYYDTNEDLKDRYDHVTGQDPRSWRQKRRDEKMGIEYTPEKSDMREYIDSTKTDLEAEKIRAAKERDDLYGRFSSWANDGGVTAEQQKRIRGNGVFDEFARTGGLSIDDVRNLRHRGTAGASGMFDNLRSKLQRTDRVTGSMNPGYTGQMSRLSRDKAQEIQEAGINTELGITDQRNKGRQWGAESLSSAEQKLVGLINQGKTYGTSGLMDLYKSVPGRESMLNANLLRAIGMNDSQINQLLAMKLNRFQDKGGINWGKVAKIAGAAAATYFTGGAAAPLLYSTAKDGVGNDADGRNYQYQDAWDYQYGDQTQA
jgi:hypothetical protein